MTELLDPSTRHIRSTAASEYQPDRRYGTENPSMTWLPLSKDDASQSQLYMVRIAPGGASRPHEHVGYEEFLMIEGELVDCDGTVFNTGDFVSFQPGSKHYSTSPQGCTLLVYTHAGSNRALPQD